jgi:hypothetical protein
VLILKTLSLEPRAGWLDSETADWTRRAAAIARLLKAEA